MDEVKQNEQAKKPLSKKFVLFGILFLILVGIVIWLLIRGNGTENTGAVQGIKDDNTQTQETKKTVPESKYFSEKSKIMYFYSDTCHWCQEEKKVLGELGYEGYRFKPMDVGKDTSLWEQYQISGTPTFIAANGDKLIGYREKDELKAWIDKHGGKTNK